MSTHHEGPDGIGSGISGTGTGTGSETHNPTAPAIDATAIAAAVGLGLLALGGWLLTTTRPWTRPDGPAVLALYWGSSLAVLLSGFVLLRRGVHAVHGPTTPLDDAPTNPGTPTQFPLIAPPEPPA
ncbi:hypothetical protein OHS33_21010 [Streptomyces sp. NBC_00536]|uniref:hypothetical protein n=1 Tax=Streptomyces sp. NBC_00536 TaxID=2975769 RepID=UPI002E82431B|nr:hypothetical protein [Streptomyces sp. NBC_00536]WUC80582.1 hypothetical protein OHS33_21010 [Streptomyces sp. NBC_00536]